MSDDGNRYGHLPTVPTEGEQNFSENGSETMENDQSGLPSWAAALAAQVTAQLQASFAAQLTQMSEEQEGRAIYHVCFLCIDCKLGARNLSARERERPAAPRHEPRASTAPSQHPHGPHRLRLRPPPPMPCPCPAHEPCCHPVKTRRGPRGGSIRRGGGRRSSAGRGRC